jgi:hypothetical protein
MTDLLLLKVVFNGQIAYITWHAGSGQSGGSHSMFRQALFSPQCFACSQEFIENLELPSCQT